MGRLEGKVAIVTGGSTGLGRETAALYAEEGARVVGADIREAAAQETIDRIRAAGSEALFVSADVSSAGDVRAMIDAAEEHFGALHIMTANAGIMGRAAGKSVEQITEEEFAEVMAVNFWGV